MFGLEMPPLTPEFWAILGTLVLLEGLLSADNALVLAVMVRHLKGELQRKALAYGIGGAVVLRILGVLLASFILEYWWLPRPTSPTSLSATSSRKKKTNTVKAAARSKWASG